MTAQAQLVLDARAATGRSVQVIKPFMHSSTRPQAFSASILSKVTLLLLLLDSRSYCCFCSPSLPSSFMKCAAPLCLFSSLILCFLSYCSSFFTHAHSLTHFLLTTRTHSKVPLPLSSTPSCLFPITKACVLPHPIQRQRKAYDPRTAAQSCS